VEPAILRVVLGAPQVGSGIRWRSPRPPEDRPRSCGPGIPANWVMRRAVSLCFDPGHGGFLIRVDAQNGRLFRGRLEWLTFGARVARKS